MAPHRDTVLNTALPSRTIPFIILALCLILLTSGCSTVSNAIPPEPVQQPTASGSESSQAGSGNPQILTITVLDVGQADSILVQTPSGKALLVDAGNRDDAQNIEALLKARQVSKLDAVLGTHPHEDHIGGMARIIRDMPVGSIYLPKASANTVTFEHLLEAIQDKGLRIDTAAAGTVMDLDPAVTCSFLAPVSGESYEDLNNTSAVLRIRYGTTTFLLCGDAEKLSEQQMLNSGADLRSDVLKVGHHGSRSSTSAAFLKRVNPRIAVISVGKGNDYKHPAESTLNRLQKFGVDVHRTDLEGSITITSDGRTASLQ